MIHTLLYSELVLLSLCVISLVNFVGLHYCISKYEFYMLLDGLPGTHVGCGDFLQCVYYECKTGLNAINFTDTNCGLSKWDFFERTNGTQPFQAISSSIEMSRIMCYINTGVLVGVLLIALTLRVLGSKYVTRTLSIIFASMIIACEVATKTALLRLMYTILGTTPYIPNFMIDSQIEASTTIVSVGVTSAVATICLLLVTVVMAVDPGASEFDAAAASAGRRCSAGWRSCASRPPGRAR